MTLKNVGFFSDLPHGSSSEVTLASAVQSHAEEYEQALVDYLHQGLTLIACPGVAVDILAGGSEMSDAPHIVTDGTWAWPGDLPYYVQRYHVRLPMDFVAHAQRSGWTVSQDIDSTLLEFKS